MSRGPRGTLSPCAAGTGCSSFLRVLWAPAHGARLAGAGGTSCWSALARPGVWAGARNFPCEAGRNQRSNSSEPSPLTSTLCPACEGNRAA